MPQPTKTISLPSVQSLLVQMKFGDQPLATGTGFVCKSKKGPVLITNWHNVTGRRPDTKQPISPSGGVPNSVSIVHNQAAKLGVWILKTENVMTRRANLAGLSIHALAIRRIWWPCH